MHPNHGFVARLVFAMTIVMAGCHVATAAELPIPPRIAPKAIPKEIPKEIPREIPKEIPKPTPNDVSIRTGPPNCASWTDECVSCTRAAKGEAAVCSNIGFACQPKAIRCLAAQ